MIQEIADGVFVQTGRYYDEQRGLVCVKDGCVLIDAPHYPDEAEEILDFADDNCGPIKMAILTHSHIDHVATLSLFPNIIVISSFYARGYLQKKGSEEFDRQKSEDDQLKDLEIVLPTITFTGEGTVYEGDERSLRCVPAPGHSRDSLIVLLQPEPIVFGGDTLSSLVPPYFPDGQLSQLRDSIIQLGNTGANMLVPGHGPILVGDDIRREQMMAVSYLDNLEKHVRAGVDQGLSDDALIMQTRWETCSDKPAPPDDLLKYHRENIVTAANEFHADTETFTIPYANI